MIYDNFLSSKEFTPVQEVLLGPNIPWYLTENMTWTDVKSDGYHFTHVFYANNTWVSEFGYVLEPLLRKLDVNAIVRIKANLYPKSDTIIEHEPHKDYDFKHMAAIFSINTNDGYTILEDGVKKIYSKENRLLMHDASALHQSTNCTDAKFRVNLVLNYF